MTRFRFGNEVRMRRNNQVEDLLQGYSIPECCQFIGAIIVEFPLFCLDV
ncbi:hypothetical protein AG1IA_10425 [Rhizoctonia solani AG-1 IA]|uniref:Uncharacterized protein n=1 Tax=Thanatephorus cucumeris (strain AG1-IA) TaxID=983506 RepID=L8WGL8_THACA|nr:hypothetical protein AG1IA_10425 [Rhizoctonia solani AG-1 IA]